MAVHPLSLTSHASMRLGVERRAPEELVIHSTSRGLDTVSWFVHSSPVRLGQACPGLVLKRTR